MNQFLQNNLLAIIVFLLVIILFLIGVLSFVVFKLLAQKATPTIYPPPQAPETPKTASEKHTPIPNPTTEKYACHNHPDQATAGTCLICEDVFCDKCLVEHEGMYFCKQHFKTYANYKWKQITDFKTSPHNPDEAMFIYNFKRKQWDKKEKPSFVLTHYKINVEEDLIESYIQLHVREEDVEEFTNGLSEFIK